MQWKPLPTNPRYDISEDGDIWDHEKMKLKRVNPGNRYPATSIQMRPGEYAQPMAIHRLVVFAFTGFLSTRYWQINHIDGDKLNYKLSNLEIVTQAENNRHYIDVVRPIVNRKKELLKNLSQQGIQ